MGAREECRREAAVEHLVTFQTAEGREGQHTAASLDEALQFVERLRNTEEASGVRVFRMQEVPIEFKTYFKVEVGEGKGDVPPSEALEQEEARPADAAPALVAAANGEGDGSDGDPGRRLFHRG